MILDFGFWIADITYKIVDYLLLKFEKIDDRWIKLLYPQFQIQNPKSKINLGT